MFSTVPDCVRQQLSRQGVGGYDVLVFGFGPENIDIQRSDSMGIAQDVGCVDDDCLHGVRPVKPGVAHSLGKRGAGRIGGEDHRNPNATSPTVPAPCPQNRRFPHETVSENYRARDQRPSFSSIAQSCCRRGEHPSPPHHIGCVAFPSRRWSLPGFHHPPWSPVGRPALASRQ